MFKELKHLGRWTAIAVAIGLLCSAASSAKPPSGGSTAPSYTFVRLDDGVYSDGVASDINDAGLVVGQLCTW